MTLQKKIITGFFLSACIVGVFVVAFLANFIEIRREIRFLEFSDTVRSKSLQLRRHEKNYFLYMERREADEVHRYIDEISSLASDVSPYSEYQPLKSIKREIEQYHSTFIDIEEDVRWGRSDMVLLLSSRGSASCYEVVGSTFLERPLLNARFIEANIKSPGDAPLRLRALSEKITRLRKTGEDIVDISKNIDLIARQRADRAVYISQIAAVVMFPLFFVFGFVTIYWMTRNAVKRLKALTAAIGEAGEGKYVSLSLSGTSDDEVEGLIRAFNKMELDLMEREMEIEAKNREIYHSKKMAYLGTMASGVAHELNNPINNIYISAQVLGREIGPDAPPMVLETVSDIYSETQRVKRIVSDLLEFSRAKPPDKKETDISELVSLLVNQARSARHMPELAVDFVPASGLRVFVDKHMIGQAIMNLIDNAIDAMAGKGTLGIIIEESGDDLVIRVSDTGSGISPANMHKLFEPFFTTKEKGTGLGLSIVYNIVEKHGGRIDVVSRPGEGAEFTITLPGKG